MIDMGRNSMAINLIAAGAFTASFLGIASNPASAETGRQGKEDPDAPASARAAPEEASFFEQLATEQLGPADLTAEQFVYFLRYYGSDPAVAEIIEEEIAKMMATGDAIPGWKETWIDMQAAIAAAEGGLESNILGELHLGLRSFTDFTGTLSPDPEGYHVYSLKPEPNVTIDERFFTEVEPGIWIEFAQGKSQDGNAFCYAGNPGMTLHSAKPHTEWTQDQLFLAGAVVGGLDRITSMDLCLVYELDEDGVYSSKAYTPDGRPIIEINSDPIPGSIVPVSQLKAAMEASE